jgi:hypothetical protein
MRNSQLSCVHSSYGFFWTLYTTSTSSITIFFVFTYFPVSRPSSPEGAPVSGPPDPLPRAVVNPRRVRL